MEANIAILYLAVLLTVGVVCQWVAWRTHLPSILYFILAGLLMGPVFRLVPAEPLFGEQTEMMISLTLAFILFEGGLSLNFTDIKEKPVVHRLLTLGLLLNLLLTAVLAHLVLDMSWSAAILVGSILMVTGPTVIIPLLQNIRLKGQTGKILLWEGMFNDSLAAIATVIIFESIIYQQFETVGLSLVIGLIVALVVSGIIGVISALIYHKLLQRAWFPQFLAIPTLFALLALVYAGASTIQAEGGLLAVTVMGVVLGNLKNHDNRSLMEFTFPIQQILIAAIFLILVSQLELAELMRISWETMLFGLLLIVVVRPLAVFGSFIGITSLTMREKWFMAFTAPRGVVAAAVASVISHQLMLRGHPDASLIMPTIVWVVALTCLIYSVLCPLLAHWLHLSEEHPNGALILGINPFTLAFAKTLNTANIPVRLMDSDGDQVRRAIFQGVPAVNKNITSARDLSQFEMGHLQYFLAASSSNKLNTLANQYFRLFFDQVCRFQLFPEDMLDGYKNTPATSQMHGSFAFYPATSYNSLALMVPRQQVTSPVPNKPQVGEQTALSSGGGIYIMPIEEDTDGEYWCHKHPDAIVLGHISGKNNFTLVCDSFPNMALKIDEKLVVLSPNTTT